MVVMLWEGRCFSQHLASIKIRYRPITIALLLYLELRKGGSRWPSQPCRHFFMGLQGIFGLQSVSGMDCSLLSKALTQAWLWLRDLYMEIVQDLGRDLITEQPTETWPTGRSRENSPLLEHNEFCSLWSHIIKHLFVCKSACTIMS